jgi:hypothetical protein
MESYEAENLATTLGATLDKLESLGLDGLSVVLNHNKQLLGFDEIVTLGNVMA